MNKKWMTQRPIAHRGLHDNITVPENSLLSFQKAVESNYPIELDVRLTKDNKLIVFHDANLKRMCNSKQSISSLTFEETQQFTLLNTNEKIPLLSDALKLVDGKVGLVIEIKCLFTYRKMCKEIHKLLRTYKGSYCFESFAPKAMRWFKMHAPEITRGMLASDFAKFPFSFIFSRLLYFKQVEPDFIAYDLRTMPHKSVTKLKEKHPSLTIITWTVKDEEMLKKAKEVADNYIFENVHQ